MASGIAYAKLSGAPTSLPPSGPAGGSLSGTYPNPGIADNVVTSTIIQDGQVANVDLADGAVTDQKVASGIAYTKLSGAPSALPPSGPAGGSLSGTYPDPGIADSAVGSDEIKDGTVSGADLAGDSVASGTIKDGTVGSADLGDGAVTKAKVAASGGISGQVLGTDGTTLRWQDDGFTPPIHVNTTSPDPLLDLVNQNGDGIAGRSTHSIGLYGFGPVNGVLGETVSAAYGVRSNTGVTGTSPTGTGVAGITTGGTGVIGLASGASGSAANTGVYGEGSAAGVVGRSSLGDGVSGTSPLWFGVEGVSTSGVGVVGRVGALSGIYHNIGVLGSDSGSGTGLQGESESGVGVAGLSTSGIAVTGLSSGTAAVQGLNLASGVGVIAQTGGSTIPVANSGVFAYSGSGTGLYAIGNGSDPGVYGFSASGHGVHGKSHGSGLSAAAVFAEATRATGIALVAQNASTDATAVLTNGGTGDLVKAFIGWGELRFRVDNYGTVYADGSYNCGLSEGCFNSGSGADLAERIDATESLEPGDVVEIDADRPGRFRRSARALSTAVAGVVSTSPAMTMNNNDLAGNDTGRRSDARPLLALVGQVPVKATVEGGPIAPGDLLVASSTPGHAMRAGAAVPTGAVIGKALGRLDAGSGSVPMLVMLR